MAQHIVSSFDEELRQLDQLLREMDELSGSMVRRATQALLEADVEIAQKVVTDDRKVDAKQRDLDDRAVTLIARRQPMAQDLRLVVGTIRMAADIERIGDLAKNIAKRVGAVGQTPISPELSTSIQSMSDLVLKQVDEVIEHYVARRPEALVELRDNDEKIDIFYTSIFRELLTYMMEDPRKITACTHLLFCAKNLERVGDHVTNIAENAYYILTGEQLPVQRPKQDELSRLESAKGS
jgi:phosphate transport system protein